MSIISNSIIKRGDKLTSSQLNGEFTAVNSAFPMNKNNLANESLDLPVFDTNNTSGKSGIILKQMDMYTNGTSTVVNANTSTASPPTYFGTIVHTESVLYTCEQNDMLRVYWNLSVETYGNNFNFSSYDNLTWVFVLEWQLSSGGAWTEVPNQGDMLSSLPSSYYGNTVLNMYGCSLESHVNKYYDPPTSTSGYLLSPKHNNYGQWYYKVPSSQTIYGLRIKCLGLYCPIWNSTINSLVIVNMPLPAVADNWITIDKSELGFIQMRDR